MCLAQKCIVDVGCTFKLFLFCKQNKVLVHLGCYTLHYIATCGLGVRVGWGHTHFREVCGCQGGMGTYTLQGVCRCQGGMGTYTLQGGV